MGLRRMLRRPKPTPIDQELVGATQGAARPRGPMQQWSRRPPEPAMAAVAADAATDRQGPAWAPDSWRIGAEDPEQAHGWRGRARARQVEGGNGTAARTKRDRAMAVHPSSEGPEIAEPPAGAPVAAEEVVAVTVSRDDDVLTVAAREIDRMAKEIQNPPSDADAELRVLQEHARKLEALNLSNPFLRKR